MARKMKGRKTVRVLVIFLVCTGAIAAIYGFSRLAAEIMDAREGRPAYTSGSTEPSSTESASQGSEPTPPMKVPGVFSEYSEKAEKKLSQMTLKEKIGQIFIFRAPESGQAELVQKYRPAGLCLMGNSFQGKTVWQVQQMTSSAQAASAIPLALCCDEEGGTVTRISSILETPFQSPMALYQQGGMEAVLSDTKQKAELLKSVGINAGLFPVADLARNQSAFIYDRTIGQDASTTARYVQQVVEELKKSKVGSTLKHFPGYGDNGDSHTAVIQDNRSLDELRQADFLPFQAGIDAGADSVLVSHNILSKIDTVPSSISPKITDLLRKELHFKGVIMTDDFDMAGLADFVSQEEAAFQVIVAGNDLILGSSYQTQIPYLLKKISSGELTEERIDESVRRVLTWKYDLGLLGVAQ